VFHSFSITHTQSVESGFRLCVFQGLRPVCLCSTSFAERDSGGRFRPYKLGLLGCLLELEQHVPLKENPAGALHQEEVKEQLPR
jgi:hypothetical protein